MASDAVIEGVSGAVGGIVATIATYPLMTVNALQATTVKHRETQHGQQPARAGGRSSVLDDVLEIVRRSGWRALFAGLGASLVGTTVSQGLYFYLYSALRQAALRRSLRGKGAADAGGAGAISVADSLLIASLAGVGNVLCTNPIWMVATRMQAHRHAPQQGQAGAEASVPPPSRPGAIAVVRSVYRDFGIAGFWKGVGASLVMVCNPTIQYAVYEWLDRLRSRLLATRRAPNSRSGGAARPPPRPRAGEVFLMSAIAKVVATLLTYPLITVKTRLMSARKADKDMQYAGIADSVRQIVARPLGLYQGLRTKIVQSVLSAALLFMAKEKISDGVRGVLAARRLELEAACAADD